MMAQRSEHDETGRRCYALCVGIGTYPNLSNHNLRYAVADATVIADHLADPQRGPFAVTVLSEPTQTTKEALDEAVSDLLSAPDRRAEDLALLYFSCHGDIDPTDGTFCLLPSNASPQEAEGRYESTALVRIADFARWFANAAVQNIVVLLDVCHSGGAGVALQQFKLNLDAGPNFFFIGAARLDQVAMQSSQLKHGLFTYCLLRAFEQPPTSDGWLTVSQIHTFISDELPWFTKERPTHIQSWSVSVNPNLPLVRNPGYPELAPLPPVWNVPWQRNVFFTGQEELLAQLARMLQGTQKTALTQPHALSGLGGIGKTQLALEYAYQHRQDYHAILWARAESTEALISTFVSIAQVLDLPEKDEPDQTIIVEAVKTWLSHRSQWLFILDNADDLGLVQAFLPPTFRGHLLLTTRAQAMGRVVESKLEVEVMQPEIGALLLLRRARIVAADALLEQAPEEEMAKAKKLTEELGGLPLALDQAGAYIEETQCGLTNYGWLYQTQRKKMLAHRRSWGYDYPESVGTTWSLSFQKVKELNPAATDLLRFCAFLAPDAIPEELLTQGVKELGDVLAPVAADPYQFDQAIATLRDYSLIDRDPHVQTLTIHRLVQVVTREALEEHEQTVWMARVIRAVNILFPKVKFDTWQQCERYLPQVLACDTWIAQRHLTLLEGASLLHSAGWYLDDRARYAEAEPLLVRALAIREQVLGAEHPATAASLDNLAVLYRKQGKYVEAEPLSVRALAIREQVLGAMHSTTAISLNNLAGLYIDQGKYGEAEPLAQRALAIWEQHCGTVHPTTASGVHNLAVLYNRQGKYVEAEPLYKRALAIREQELGVIHPDTVASLNGLGTFYLDQEKCAEAEPLLVRALAIREQELGAMHPDVAESLNNLAGLYRVQGRDTEAELLYERVLSICEKQLSGKHPSMAISLNNLAGLYRDQGKYVNAELLYKRALVIREEELGAMHPDTAASLDNLAGLYRVQGRDTEAELLYERAFQIRLQQLGEQHPDTALSLNNLAGLYVDQGMCMEAETMYESALIIFEQALSSEHSLAQTVRENYALFLRKMGREEEAMDLEEGL